MYIRIHITIAKSLNSINPVELETAFDDEEESLSKLTTEMKCIKFSVWLSQLVAKISAIANTIQHGLHVSNS